MFKIIPQYIQKFRQPVKKIPHFLMHGFKFYCRQKMGARQKKITRIKRGLSAVEAAVLLETPLDRVLTMVLFGLIKKGAAKVVKEDPLTLERLDTQVELRDYESEFLKIMVDKPKNKRNSGLQSLMIRLVKAVQKKMKGFSSRETRDYYRAIMRKAWEQIERAETPEVRRGRGEGGRGGGRQRMGGGRGLEGGVGGRRGEGQRRQRGEGRVEGVEWGGQGMQGGVLEATLYFDELTTEVIADGKHLAPELLQLALKIKGPDRLALATDCSRALDLPEGRYVFGALDGGEPFLHRDGVGVMPDGKALASSVRGMDHMVRTFVELTDRPVWEVVRMATLTPARIAGWEREVGSLEVGKRADLLVLDRDLNVRHSLIAGREVPRASGGAQQS